MGQGLRKTRRVTTAYYGMVTTVDTYFGQAEAAP